MKFKSEILSTILIGFIAFISCGEKNKENKEASKTEQIDTVKTSKNTANSVDTNLENKKWILTEVMGQKIESADSDKMIHLMFSDKHGIISGHNGCNLFSGSYELMSGNRLKSGPFANTLIACQDMDTATKFMGVLEKADNYTIDEGVLNLNKARMAPLAKFRIE